MWELVKAASVQIFFDLAFAAGLVALYRFVIPHRALLLLAAALLIAEDTFIVQWLAKQGNLLAEVCAAVMGMLCALFAVKAAMLVARTDRIVPHTAFLTLALSVMGVMLFQESSFFPFQLAICQLALSLPFMEAAIVIWKGRQQQDRLNATLAIAFLVVALSYIARIAYAPVLLTHDFPEQAFYASSYVAGTRAANHVAVFGGLIVMMTIIVREHFGYRKKDALAVCQTA